MKPGTEYRSAEDITISPGESKAVKFIADDGTEHVFIVSVPPSVDVVTVITANEAFNVPFWETP